MTANAFTPDDQVVQMMMNAISATPLEPQEDNAVEYNWDSPNRFSLSAREDLQKFIRKAQLIVSEKLDELLRTESKLGSPSITEYYGRQLNKQLDGCGQYGMALTEGGDDVGLVLVDKTQSVRWTEMLLGGPGDDPDGSRKLSSLETAVLLDAFKTIATAMMSSLETAGAKPLGITEKVIPEELLPEMTAADEFCRIDMQLEDAPLASIILPSKRLDAIVKSDNAVDSKLSAEEARSRMLGHIGSAHVQGRIDLGVARITMRDVVALEAGDVLLLNRKVDEPSALSVAGKDVALGFPSQCQGQYALQIAQVTGLVPGT